MYGGEGHEAASLNEIENYCITVKNSSGYNQEPITQREGALNLCMYADFTCCQTALAQNSLYGKCYVRAIIYSALV